MFSPFSMNCRRGFLLESVDVRLRLTGLIAGLLLVFLASKWIHLVPAIALVVLLQASAWSGWKELLRSLISFWLFYVIVFLLHVFTTDGEAVLRIARILTVTTDGVKAGVFFCGKIALLVMSFRPILNATHPGDLMKVFEVNTYPDEPVFSLRLKQIWNRGSLTFGLAVRFIPLIFEEANRIRQAQISRCGFDSAKGLAGLYSIPKLIVPLVNSIFRRADQITVAMESRAFVIDGVRTPAVRKTFGWLDYIALLVLIVICYAGYFVNFR